MLELGQVLADNEQMKGLLVNDIELPDQCMSIGIENSEAELHFLTWSNHCRG